MDSRRSQRRHKCVRAQHTSLLTATEIIPLTRLSTLPGFDVRIPRGATASMGFKDGKSFHNNLESSVTWRAPRIEIQNGKIYANIAIGPRFTLSTALPGMSKYAFGMETRFDVPKLEVALGQAKGPFITHPNLHKARPYLTSPNTA